MSQSRASYARANHSTYSLRLALREIHVDRQKVLTSFAHRNLKVCPRAQQRVSSVFHPFTTCASRRHHRRTSQHVLKPLERSRLATDPVKVNLLELDVLVRGLLVIDGLEHRRERRHADTSADQHGDLVLEHLLGRCSERAVHSDHALARWIAHLYKHMRHSVSKQSTARLAYVRNDFVPCPVEALPPPVAQCNRAIPWSTCPHTTITHASTHELGCNQGMC